MVNIITFENAKVLFARTHAISHVLLVVLACIFATTFLPTNKAVAQTKTLKLYYLHTREKNKITYYKNGKYINSALKKINWALRDWRLNEPTKMDPKLLDLVWEAYRQSGSKAYIHVISGYRSPVTNEKLRKRGGGQAKKSQHTRGKALDFYLPDVKISKMRAIGLKMGVGGVGYYPRSGSPFVHLDTGSVRHWPRMTRKQLARVFPKGKTMHIPTDGKPLAKYKVAVAEYKSRSRKGNKIPTTSKKELNFFQRLAAKANSDEKADAVQSAPILPRTVKTVKAPSPRPNTVKPVQVQPIVGTASAAKAIEKTAPLSITEPLPKPEPKLPEVPKTEFAILAERKVPLPLVSPRNVITPIAKPEDEKPIVVAALEPEILTPQIALPETPQEPLLEPVPESAPGLAPGLAETTKAQEEALSNAQDLSIPLPVKRPQTEAKPKPEIKPDIQIASLEAENKSVNNPAINKEQILRLPTTLNQPALTANEIEDLRKLATPKLEEKPAPEIQIALGNNKLRSTKDIIKTDARLTNENTDNQNTLADAITPKAEPIAEPEEKSIIALNNIPIPTQNPRFKIEVPQTPKEEIIIASLDKKVINNTGLGKRTVSLDKFSAPQDNKSSIGQYALANSFSIRDLNAVKAPAYGRNVIRKVPNAVFVDGFRNTTNINSNYGFSGKAVVFKKFARLAK